MLVRISNLVNLSLSLFQRLRCEALDSAISFAAVIQTFETAAKVIAPILISAAVDILQNER
jgi:hypothetical protein